MELSGRTDPVDAAIRRYAEGTAGDEDVLGQLPNVRLGIAISDEGTTISAAEPGERPAVLVTTAAAHRAHVRASQWLELSIEELAPGTTKAGVDLLVNPGSAVSLRIPAAALRRFVEEAPENGE